LNRYQETFKTWNKIAEIYEDKFMDLNLYNDTYDIFCELIPVKNSKILEIACGPGNITKYLINKNSNYKIKGIDISPNMIARAKLNNPTASFEVMDIRNIDKVNSLFDAIICGFGIPYLSKSDCSKLLVDYSKLLIDDGIIYLSFVEGDYDKSTYQIGSTGDRTYFYFHSLDVLKDELKANSFEIIKFMHKKYERADGTEELHTILIARKTIMNINY